MLNAIHQRQVEEAALKLMNAMKRTGAIEPTGPQFYALQKLIVEHMGELVSEVWDELLD